MAEPPPLLTIVLPTRNERLNAPLLVLELRQVFQDLWPSLSAEERRLGLELVVIDDSDDGTIEALEQAWSEGGTAGPTTSLRCLRQRSRGFSCAISEGLSQAQGRWILALNADGQHRSGDAVALFQARRSGTVIIGSRFIAGGATPYSLIRELMSLLASRLVALISGVPLRDCFSSFFLVEREALQSLDLEAVVHGRGEGMLNLVACLREQGVDLTEWPITTVERRSGESKTDLMRFLAAYLQAAWQLRRQRQPSRWVLLLARLLPPAVLIALLVHDPGSLRQLLAHPGTVLACAAVLMACTWLRAVRWQQIARVAGLRQPLLAAIEDVAHGRLMNELLPVRVGEVVRISRIQGRDGSSLTPVLLCLLWEKITGFSIGLLGFAVLFGLAWLQPAAGGVLALSGLAAISTILGSTLLWGLLLATVQGGRRWLSRHPAGRWSRSLLEELAMVEVRCSGLDWSMVLPLKPWLAATARLAAGLGAIPIASVFATSLVGYAIWSCTALSLALLASAFGMPLNLLEAGAAAFAAGVFSQVRLLPQAAGQPELAMALVLTSLGHPLGASVLLATADLLLQRAITILFGVMMLRRGTVLGGGQSLRTPR